MFAIWLNLKFNEHPSPSKAFRSMAIMTCTFFVRVCIGACVRVCANVHVGIFVYSILLEWAMILNFDSDIYLYDTRARTHSLKFKCWTIWKNNPLERLFGAWFHMIVHAMIVDCLLHGKNFAFARIFILFHLISYTMLSIISNHRMIRVWNNERKRVKEIARKCPSKKRGQKRIHTEKTRKRTIQTQNNQQTVKRLQVKTICICSEIQIFMWSLICFLLLFFFLFLFLSLLAIYCLSQTIDLCVFFCNCLFCLDLNSFCQLYLSTYS